MAYYSSQIINQVKQLDLLTYLKNFKPDELVKINNYNYCTKEHDSLKISNGKWYWFSQGFGGYSALDYLIKVKNYSFLEALKELSNCIKNVKIKYEQLQERKDIEFKLPERNSNNDIVIKYLTGRGIDKDIISECIDNDLIYEEKFTHNVVFIGYDRFNKGRYAMCRSTQKDNRFMIEVRGSHKAFSFKLESQKETDTVHLFESAIDLLSYATLFKMDNKEWYNQNLLSVGGVFKPQKDNEYKSIPVSLNLFLNNNPKVNKIILHFDNDSAGRSATVALTHSLENRYTVIDEPAKYGKDINDFLMYKISKKKEMER